MNLKNSKNQDIWTALTKYHISSKIYHLHKDFHYLKQNSIAKTEHPKIQFCHKDIITYLQNNAATINLNSNVRQIYKDIIKNEYTNHNIIEQSIWNQLERKIP